MISHGHEMKSMYKPGDAPAYAHYWLARGFVFCTLVVGGTRVLYSTSRRRYLPQPRAGLIEGTSIALERPNVAVTRTLTG